MIYGIGIDTVQVERIAKSLQKERFLQRVYSPGERALFAARGEKHAAESAAAGFAAKEAFLKAAGVGLGGFALAEIGALRKDTGQPYIAPEGKVADFLRENSLVAHLSITHEGGLATAFVVLEKRQG